MKPQTISQDLLADLFSGIDIAPSTPATVAAAPSRNGVNEIMSLFGGDAAPTGNGIAATSVDPAAGAAGGMPADLFASSSTPAASTPSSFVAFTSSVSGLQLSFLPTKDASKPNIVNITAKFTASASTSGPLQGISFQAAVPKTMKLQMMAISNADLAPSGEATQLLRVMVPPGGQLRLRLRIAYTYQGQQQQEQADYAFPAGAI